jgi:hypothetical protein
LLKRNIFQIADTELPSNYMQLWPSAAQHYRMAGSEQEPEDALADRCLVWSL